MCEVCVQEQANLNTVQPGVKWNSLVDTIQCFIVSCCVPTLFTLIISLDQRHGSCYHLYFNISDMAATCVAHFQV